MKLQLLSFFRVGLYNHSYKCTRYESCFYMTHKRSKSTISRNNSNHITRHKNSKMSHQEKILTSKLTYKQPETENIGKFIIDGLNKNQTETIIIDADSGRSWTGLELKRAVIQLANFLKNECHLKKGDVCSLYHLPDDTVPVCILGITLAGGVTNYLSGSNTAREVHDTASVLKSKFLLSDHDTLLKIHPNVVDIEKSLCIISTTEPIKQKYTKTSLSIQNILQKKSRESSELDDGLLNRINEIQPDDFAIVQFSSGTTGKPKPIPRTSKNLVHLVASVDHKEMMDLHPGVVMTGSLPITHRPGLWALLASVHCGSTLVIWSNLSDVDSALATIEKFKVTIFSSSLPFLSMLGNIPEKSLQRYNLSTWKHIITSGAKIVHDNLPKKLMVQFHLDSLRQCFGMTESGWVFLIEQTLARDNYLSVGHVCPGMEAKVIDRKTGLSLVAEERGEIALKGPQVFPGYLTDIPGKLNRSDFGDDGWFRIGDQGYYNKDGLVYIEGRYKESMILGNNYLVFPTEIEALISEHPAVEGVCVVKIEIKKDFAFDIAKACITLKHGCKTTETEILNFLLERDSQAILAGGVEILDKFPRLGNGKVDKQTLAKSIRIV